MVLVRQMESSTSRLRNTKKSKTYFTARVNVVDTSERSCEDGAFFRKVF